MTKKTSSHSDISHPASKAVYVGNNAFPDGLPVCKPVVPGRHPKPLEGPVHPGFKGKPKPPKKTAPTKAEIVRSDQNDDLYKPLKKIANKPKKRK